MIAQNRFQEATNNINCFSLICAAFGPPNLARNGSPSLPSAMEVYTKASTTQLLLDVQSCIHCAPAVGLPKTGRSYMILYDII
jgi:hypothetical protein